jgi:hypothetical protein
MANNVHTLTSTKQPTNGKPTKKEPKKGGAGNPNIHTLDSIANVENDDDTSSEAEMLTKAHELLTLFQGDIDTLKRENIGLKCVIEEYGKRYNDRGEYIENLQRRLEVNNLKKQKVNKVGKNMNNTIRHIVIICYKNTSWH